MSQPDQPASTNELNLSAGSKKSRWGTAAIVGLALIVILSLGFASYTALNPHAVTVTQQQALTNTQSVYSVQTQTVMTVNTVTSVTTVTYSPPTTNGYGIYSNPQFCGYNGCSYQSPGYYYPGYYNCGYYYCGYNNGYYGGYYYYSLPCQAASNGNSTCSGYLYQAQNGCTLLAISTTSNPYPSRATGSVLEYISLQHLPSSTPQPGSWITVTGQLYQGYNTASNGASCPTNYMVVSTIT